MELPCGKLSQQQLEGIQITIHKAPKMGQPEDCAWQYRVHASRVEDWSGSAPTEDDAWSAAKARRDEIVLRCK